MKTLPVLEPLRSWLYKYIVDRPTKNEKQDVKSESKLLIYHTAIGLLSKQRKNIFKWTTAHQRRINYYSNKSWLFYQKSI